MSLENVKKQKWTDEDWEQFRSGPEATKDDKLEGIVTDPEGGTLATSPYCQWAIDRCNELGLPYIFKEDKAE